MSRPFAGTAAGSGASKAGASTGGAANAVSEPSPRSVRPWLRGLGNVTKAHVLKCAAYNLGLLLRKVWGLGKPRSAAGLGALFFRLWTAWRSWLGRIARRGPIHHAASPAESGFIPPLAPR